MRSSLWTAGILLASVFMSDILRAQDPQPEETPKLTNWHRFPVGTWVLYSTNADAGYAALELHTLIEVNADSCIVSEDTWDRKTRKISSYNHTYTLSAPDGSLRKLMNRTVQLKGREMQYEVWEYTEKDNAPDLFCYSQEFQVLVPLDERYLEKSVVDIEDTVRFKGEHWSFLVTDGCVGGPCFFAWTRQLSTGLIPGKMFQLDMIEEEGDGIIFRRCVEDWDTVARPIPLWDDVPKWEEAQKDTNNAQQRGSVAETKETDPVFVAYIVTAIAMLAVCLIYLRSNAKRYHRSQPDGD